MLDYYYKARAIVLKCISVIGCKTKINQSFSRSRFAKNGMILSLVMESNQSVDLRLEIFVMSSMFSFLLLARNRNVYLASFFRNASNMSIYEICSSSEQNSEVTY